MTKLQKAILNAVTERGGHLSADEVYWIVKQQFPSVALGTIYRNLNRFAQLEQLRRVGKISDADYFEVNTVPHDHARCINCGKLQDFAAAEIKELIKGQVDGDIVSYDLTVDVICESCLSKK